MTFETPAEALLPMAAQKPDACTALEDDEDLQDQGCASSAEKKNKIK